MLKIRNLSKKFDGKTVFENLNLDFPEGKTVCLTGNSGIGKTTLLNIIAGIEKADGGEITNTFKKIAYMFQEPRLIEWLSALDNINIVLGDSAATLPEAQKWLEAVGLKDNESKTPAELSGGMKQRIALARTLAYGGDIYLFDEPFVGMDYELKLSMLGLIRKYCEAPDSLVIIVTHDSDILEELRDFIISL